MALSACGVDLEDVRVLRDSVQQAMALVAVALNGRLPEMAGVREIVKGESCSSALIEFQRYRLIGMTASARSKFLSGLMSMTGITLGMPRKARLNRGRIKLMAGVASGHFCAWRHFGAVEMLFMREALEAELQQPCREQRHFRLCFEGNLMAHDTQLAIGRCVVDGMT